MILAGDVGGTKSRLAFFETSEKGQEIKVEKVYQSKNYSNFSEIIQDFISTHHLIVKKACFGVAGPVEFNCCRATNLPWVIDGNALSKEFKIPSLFLINDLLANAHGLSCLAPEEFFILNEGKPHEKGNAALISAGTGLGEAGIFWNGNQHHPFACEGGHVDFAARNELEVELWRYLAKKFEHISYERILSGSGLYLLYQFLIDMKLEKENPATKEELLSKDPGKVVSEKAIKKEDKACERALEWFVSLYGAEAGNLALKFLALSGVYVGGGIAPKILPALKTKTFFQAFISKGRFSSLLESISIKVILNEKTALLGAAKYVQVKA